MITEEENKAIDYFKSYINAIDTYGTIDKNCCNNLYEPAQVVLGLVEKQAKEIEEYEKARKEGTLSDGYHTYNDLYYQRCILFATICNMNKNISWKSKKHSDGNKCFDSDNWFIVGIDTPKGSYTYHYEMKYWDLFNVPELELGKEWDGHTEKDVTRLLSLINNNVPKDKIKELFKKYNINITEEEITVDGLDALSFIEEIDELLEEAN